MDRFPKLGGRTARPAVMVIAAVFGLFGPGKAPAKVVINEIMAVNQSTTTTIDGQYDDWVELYNTSAVDVDLSNWYLSDNFSTPTKWRIPVGITIPALGRIVIWANDTPPNPARPLYASFRLGGEDGERLGLYHADGVTTESSMVYGHQAADISYGSVLDGLPILVPFRNATPGHSNNGYVPPPASLAGTLFINEWMARNQNTIDDNSGQSDDWVEIYNSSDIAIDLGDYYLTDAATTPTKWQIPKSNIVGPHDFILFWCDDDEEQGLTHASFNLNGDGEQLGLFEQDGSTPIDLLGFGPQTPDISEGKWPDGSSVRKFFSHPTPRESNVVISTRAIRWSLYR